MNNTKALAFVGILLVGVAGYALGYYQGAGSYSEKTAAIKKMFPAPTQATSLTGKVERVSSASLTLGELSLSPNLLAVDNYPMTREVMITGATKITKAVNKTPVVFQEEIAAFQKKRSENATTRTGNEALPPTPFTLTDIKLSDLSVGDTVVVVAANDILHATSFTAIQVQVNK